MLKPGQQVPDLDLPLTIDAQYDLAHQTPEHFTVVIFYRGKHCPICKSYLEQWAGKLDAYAEAGINVVAVSMDDQDRAAVTHEEWDTGDLPIAYGLSEQAARQWGLFLSSKREDSDEPDRFSEPGLFVVRPDGSLYFEVVQNAPFTRPSPDELLEGLKFVIQKDYPVRGTLD